MGAGMLALTVVALVLYRHWERLNEFVYGQKSHVVTGQSGNEHDVRAQHITVTCDMIMLHHWMSSFIHHRCS